MKTVLSILLAGMLAGCATTSPSQFYRPANYAGQAWAISGEYSDVSQVVAVKINGQQAVAGKLSFWTGSGEFSGEYDGRNVQASCLTSIGLWAPVVNCNVFIGGERAATLTF